MGDLEKLNYCSIYEMYNHYKMIDEPELYNFITKKLAIKNWQIIMKEAKKDADFNKLANGYFDK